MEEMTKKDFKIMGILGLSIMLLGLLVSTYFGIWGGNKGITKVAAFLGMSAMVLGLLAIAALLLYGIYCIYFFPWKVAKNRNHKQKEAIFVLNLCLGWTFLGWVIALVWANTSQG
ncbi:MAG: superinfection immunity protein [Nanoarchaeota archaeon]|nr:superinfection immunity protein [Nanoarchaeota archaeon]